MVEFNNGILGTAGSILTYFTLFPKDELISYSSTHMSGVVKGDSILSMAAIGKQVFAGSECGKIYSFRVNSEYHWYDWCACWFYSLYILLIILCLRRRVNRRSHKISKRKSFSSQFGEIVRIAETRVARCDLYLAQDVVTCQFAVFLSLCSSTENHRL